MYPPLAGHQRGKIKTQALPHYHTCYHVIHRAHYEQHLLDEAHLSACLQVSDTFSQDGGEHAPDFSLTCDVTVPQQLHHAADAFCILDNEVCLQVKLPSHQLQNRIGGIGFFTFLCDSHTHCLNDVIVQHEETWIKLNFTLTSGFQPCCRSAFFPPLR